MPPGTHLLSDALILSPILSADRSASIPVEFGGLLLLVQAHLITSSLVWTQALTQNLPRHYSLLLVLIDLRYSMEFVV